jgi:hypothetical protein
MHRLLSLLFCMTLAASAAQAKVATPGLAEGGNLPLADILDIAKPYPNLTLQVRLQLVRANLRRDQVACTGSRFGNEWTNLGGARLAPYACPIGKRTLAITANQIYFDKNGRKVSAGDPDLMKKAAKVKENGLVWRWK